MRDSNGMEWTHYTVDSLDELWEITSDFDIYSAVRIGSDESSRGTSTGLCLGDVLYGDWDNGIADLAGGWFLTHDIMHIWISPLIEKDC